MRPTIPMKSAVATFHSNDRNSHTLRKEYVDKEYGSFAGKTISSVRPLTRDECDAFGWRYEYSFEAMVIIFTDGSALVPMCDPEGNGHGHLEISSVKKSQ